MIVDVDQIADEIESRLESGDLPAVKRKLRAHGVIVDFHNGEMRVNGYGRVSRAGDDWEVAALFAREQVDSTQLAAELANVVDAAEAQR